ncbi:MAG: histidine phosphatase family protein [Planctomycetaceae bacterium]|nr:histidine phosphatase family protein [Planctomycetaceae bacterium]
MRRILLMRHAKSSWKESAVADLERPLNRRGRESAPRMGKWMREQQLAVDYCLCSPSVRTQETFRLWQEAYETPVELRLVSDLYCGSPDDIVNVLQTVQDRYHTVLVLAHNPGLEMLAERWSGEWRKFRTAAVAVFSADDLEHWADLKLNKNRPLLEFQFPKGLEED